MKILTEIDRSPGLRHDGRKITREAVRAIIAHGSRLLMIHSMCDGDYKFPGGGIKPGEDHLTALAREVNEESGATLAGALVEYGKVIEYDRPVEKHYDLFVMTSYYYRCQVGAEMGLQHLDRYESALGFTPEWISIADAFANNRELLDKRNGKLERWVNRETTILQMLMNELERKTNVQSTDH